MMYEYRVYSIGEAGEYGIRFYDYFAAFLEYKRLKEEDPTSFVTIEKREQW